MARGPHSIHRPRARPSEATLLRARAIAKGSPCESIVGEQQQCTLQCIARWAGSEGPLPEVSRSLYGVGQGHGAQLLTVHSDAAPKPSCQLCGV